MASKQKKPEGCDYRVELKKLKTSGPARIYVLYGAEEYLRDYFLEEIKKIILPDGDDGFSYHRFEGPDIDKSSFEAAVDTMPFLSERTLVEFRGVDLNKCSDSEGISAILKNIPDYCTVVFIMAADYLPDGRLKINKTINAGGEVLYFAEQKQEQLFKWIDKRFAAYGKSIGPAAKSRLISISGDLMNRLIPEIGKIAAFASGSEVTVADVEAVASKIPEAQAFDLVNYIAEKNYDKAITELAEVLRNQDNSAISMLALLGFQLRRILGVKLMQNEKLGKAEIMDELNIFYDIAYTSAAQAAKRFSYDELQNALEICADYDYLSKSTSQDDALLFRDAIIKIIRGKSDGTE